VFAGVIGGFKPDVVIDLPDVMVAVSGVIEAGNILAITLAGGGMLELRLDPTEDFQFVTVNVNGDLITLNPPCFRAGTLIETTRGPVAVEALRIGDHVLTAGPGFQAGPVGSGTNDAPAGPATRPVTWIGHRTVRCDIHPDPSRVWPVRVRAGAFAAAEPNRDLWLSPDHALYLDGVLVPVRHLIDGEAVAQVPMASVTYFHVELPLHDVVLAEGLPCESYLDSGDRANFANGGPVVTLHPDFARVVARHRPDRRGGTPAAADQVGGDSGAPSPPDGAHKLTGDKGRHDHGSVRAGRRAGCADRQPGRSCPGR